MTFDVETEVEKVLSLTIKPKAINSFNIHYFTLEKASRYILFGNRYSSNLSTVEIIWTDSKYLGYFSRFLICPTLIISEPCSGLCSEEPMRLGRRDLTSQQDWKRFLEKDLPEFIKRKSVS